MRRAVACVLVLLGGMIAGCSLDQDKPKGAGVMNDSLVRQDVLAIQDQRIFFGHQSVGDNIVQGMRDILQDNPDVAISIIPYTDSTSIPKYFFAETHIGENTRPDLKCSDFTRKVEVNFGGRLDVALMKLCFVDITKDTDVDGVFSEYIQMMDSLKSRHPSVIFVHVTVPLMAKTGCLKKMYRAIRGRPDNYVLENIKRTGFNRKLQEYYSGDPIFDLAAVESTHPDGRREDFEEGGAKYSNLLKEYTTDDGHLNRYASRLAARELIRVIAAAVRGKHAPGTPP